MNLIDGTIQYNTIQYNTIIQYKSQFHEDFSFYMVINTSYQLTTSVRSYTLFMYKRCSQKVD